VARSTRAGGKGAGKDDAFDSETPKADPAAESSQPSEPGKSATDEPPDPPAGPEAETDIVTPEGPTGPLDDADAGVEDAVLVQPAVESDADQGVDPGPDSPALPEPEPEPVEPETMAHEATAPEPPKAATPVPPPQSVSRPSFVPMVLGGVIAAALGYAAAWTDILPRPPDPALTARVDTLSGAQTAQEARVTGLASDLSDLAARPVEDADARELIEAAMAQIEVETAATRALFEHVDSRLEAAGSEMEALADRLTALEDRPQVTVALSEAAQEAVEAQIAALRSEAAEAIARVEADRETLAAQSVERFDALQAELRAALAAIEAEQESLQAARAEAAAEAQANRQAAAAAALRAALDAGGPYAEPLQAFVELSGTVPPAALADRATDGIPTLSALREAFPDAARAGLEAALRVRMDAGEVGRIEGFMRIHSGIRSLSPQEGDDPDAVLSRAEAALAEADIAGALALIDTLPPEGRGAMQAWVDQAETRLSALSALSALGEN
jgi:hypothetical protein